MTISQFLMRLTFSGLEYFGKFYSSYHGFVVSNEDPEKRNRLFVIVPEAFGPDAQGQWAIPRGLYSGKGFGSQLLPEEGDMVLISFRHGNPDYPMWEFASYGEKELPKEFYKQRVKGLITPSGIKVLLDGEDFIVSVESPKGDTIKITDKAIEFSNKSGLSFLIKEGEIQFGKDTLAHLVKGEDLQDILNSLIAQLKTWSEIIQVDPTSHKSIVPFNPSGLAEKINKVLSKYS